MFGTTITLLMELHQVINNVFAKSLCQRQEKKLKLKTRIKDIEYVIDQGPLLMTSLAI